MFSSMINPTIRTGITPSVSSMLNGTVSSQVLESLNRECGGGTTFFGSPQDVFAARDQAFMTNIVERCQAAAYQINRTVGVLDNRNFGFYPYTDHLLDGYVPIAEMVPHILSSPVVRPLFEAGQIHGWGCPVEKLPIGDPVGRLIANGQVTVIQDESVPKEMIWNWQSGDPNYTDDDLRALGETRRYVDNWFNEQLGLPRGTGIDLTDFPNNIGRLIPVKKG